jgi:hypothetical protein
MTETTRLDLELADALGLTQAVRAAAADAAARVHGDKLWRRLATIDADLAPLQEQLNELVVADPHTRTQLTRRSLRVREAETDDLRDGADPTDALQALAAATAAAVAQWQVVRRLAKADGHRAARKLANHALPLAEEHLAMALKCGDRVAKRAAEQPASPASAASAASAG